MRSPSGESGAAATFGVLADTHVPDRLRAIPERVLELLGTLGLEAILHAGDICRPDVRGVLSAIAPVEAVRGNRDVLWPGNWSLPRTRIIERGGHRIVLTHGDRGAGEYVARLRAGRRGKDTPDATERRLLTRFDGADAIVYGHTHVPRVRLVEGTLLMNPGSIAPAHYTALGATIGLLHVSSSGVTGEIVRLDAPEERVTHA